MNSCHENFDYELEFNLKRSSPLKYNIWMKNLMNSDTLFAIQIVQLTASGNFEEALALCRMLPQEDSSLRAAKEQSIHIRSTYPLHSFPSSKFALTWDSSFRNDNLCSSIVGL